MGIFRKQVKSRWEYKKALDEATDYAKAVKQEETLRAIRHANDVPRQHMSFSKKIFIFIAINLVVIEAYAMWAMVHFQDFSSLYSLIGLATPIVGIVASFITYSNKSAIENSKGGIIYETTMKEMEGANYYFDEEDKAVG